MMAIAFFNGDWIAENQLSITESNRSFRYGDGFFETIAYKEFKALWLPYHFERIKTSAKILQIALPDFFSFEYFEEIISLIAQKNDLSNARIRFHVFRDGAGTYLPETDKASFLCSAVPYSYTEHSKVVENVVIYRDNVKPKTPLSNVKSANALIYILAAKFAESQNAEDAIVLNSSGRICEAISSNVFLIHGDKITTPFLSEGCVSGIIRNILIGKLNATEAEISEADLLSADAIFLTNTIKGIRPVSKIGNKDFDTSKVKAIINLFSKL